MPVRFRCAYCNQLLGISRRKVGTVVRCPTCAGQVVVPTADTDGPGQGHAPGPTPGSPPLFEQNDFADLFNAPAPEPESPPLPARAPASASAPAPVLMPVVPLEPVVDVEPLNLDPLPLRPTGIVLTPIVATVLTVGIILALALAFLAGLLVGRWITLV